MKVLQISDTHLRVDGKLSFGKENTPITVSKSIEYLAKLKDQPDFYVLTGDLCDNGIHEAYVELKKQLKKLPKPVYILPGNHDNRDEFVKVFGKEMCPIQQDIEPFICYTIQNEQGNVVVVDTSVSHTHWGSLNEKVAKWLKHQLEQLEQQQKGKPTLVFTHHVPFLTGMSKMDEPFENANEFAKILKTHSNVKLCTGHIHCSIATFWQGIPVQTCPPISMLMELDLKPGGGDKFFTADAGFVLHHFIENRINSHTRTIPIGANWQGPFPFAYYADDK